MDQCWSVHDLPDAGEHYTNSGNDSSIVEYEDNAEQSKK